MGTAVAAALVSGIIGLIGTLVSQKNAKTTEAWNTEATNRANQDMTNATNEANKEMTESTNQANKEMTENTNQAQLDIADLTNQANKDIAKETNQMNYDVAMQNLDFQKDLQEYNKALQQQLFEREDTSYQRTAKDMIKAGLNPLSMQGTNGSGEAIALSPLQNLFKAEQSSPMQMAQLGTPQFQASHFERAQFQKAALPLFTGNNVVNAISSFASQMNSILTGNLERDSLKLENERKDIENIVLANKYGIDLERKARKGYFYGEPGEKPTNQLENEAYRSELLNKIREYNHKVDIGRYDSDTDIEKMLTAITDWTVNGRTEEQLQKLREKYPLIDTFINFAQKKYNKAN